MQLKSLVFIENYKMFKAGTKFTFCKDKLNIIIGAGGSGKSILVKILCDIINSKEKLFEGCIEAEYFVTEYCEETIIIDDAICILNESEINNLFNIFNKYMYELNKQVIVTVRSPYYSKEKISDANWIKL